MFLRGLSTVDLPGSKSLRVCKVVGFVPTWVSLVLTGRGWWLVAKLVCRVKLVSELPAG
jgi:hypothetical protein